MSERTTLNSISSLNDSERLGDPIYLMFGYPSKVFYKHIAKFIEHYTQLGKLIEVDGEGSVDEIGERIVSAFKRMESIK